MDTVFDEVDKRTSLALSNQMEMLVFYLNDQQLYGINVFKIIEIIECPNTVTKIPLAHPSVIGTVDFRGKAIVTIDLGDVLGLPGFDYKNNLSYIIICEYNNAINGFLIKNPDKLINRGWEEIKSPTGLLSHSGYLTAIAYDDNNETIQVLDIEKILAEIVGISQELSIEIKEKMSDMTGRKVLVVDDSQTARIMVKSVLDQAGIQSTVMDSATGALQLLEGIYVKGADKTAGFDMIICDIEMPGMDGFTFTRKVRETPETAGIYVVLHSSLSNPSNKAKAELVGANDFISKFQPDILITKVLEKLSGK